MPVTSKVLIPPTPVNASGPSYTANGVTTVIDKFTARNVSDANADLIVYLVDPLGAAGDTNVVVRRTLAVGETYIFPEVVGHVLMPGGKIQLGHSVLNAINVRVCGREIN